MHGDAEYVVLQRRRHSRVVVCIKLPKIARHNENQHRAVFHFHATAMRDMDNVGPIRCFTA
jgi:hypothetical protein